MSIDHEFLVGLAKSLGLFILMAIFFGTVVYALWPSNQDKFDHAARNILDADDLEADEDETPNEDIDE
jgi:cytochrome c oxidase cbb3-type subunit 4